MSAGVSIPNQTLSVTVANQTFALAGMGSDVLMLGFSEDSPQPTHPLIVGKIPTSPPGLISDVYAVKEFNSSAFAVLISVGFAVQIAALEPTGRQTVVSAISAPHGMTVGRTCTRDGLAYISLSVVKGNKENISKGAVEIWNITNVHLPVKISGVSINQPSVLAVALYEREIPGLDDFLFAATSTGIQAINIKNKASPTLDFFVPIDVGDPDGIALQQVFQKGNEGNPLLLVAAGGVGLLGVDLVNHSITVKVDLSWAGWSGGVAYR
jgi:hypothetical protein